MVRKRLANHTRKATEALLTGYVHFRDILYGLMKDRVYKQDDFKWQVQFKFELKNSLEVVFKSAYETGGIRRLETNKVEVDMECLGNIRSYGFEYLGNCQRLVCTPLTERC
jgi:dynein heavy chain